MVNQNKLSVCLVGTQVLHSVGCDVLINLGVRTQVLHGVDCDVLGASSSFPQALAITLVQAFAPLNAPTLILCISPLIFPF